MSEKHWGQISEIDVEDIPGGRIAYGKYAVLWQEILLRLEKTPASRALVVPFKVRQEMRKADRSLRRYAETRLGRHHITIRTRSNGNGGGALYISRGEQWKRKSSPKLQGSK